MKVCPNCNAVNEDTYKFCKDCGYDLSSRRDRLRGFSANVKMRANEKLDSIKKGLDSRISNYLQRLDDPAKIKIGNIRIPDSERDNIRNALVSFKSRMGTGSNPELSEEFQEWLDALPSRLEAEKCIVCFASWKDSLEDIVVCPHCQNGGHILHLKNWLNTKPECPLCRQRLTPRELIKVDLKI